MGKGKVVALLDVLRMLDECAKGHSLRKTDHHLRVEYNGRTYPTLPLGDHGRGRINGRAEIFAGHVRQMVAHLRIDKACAQGKIACLY